MACNDNSENVTCRLSDFPAVGGAGIFDHLIDTIGGVGAVITGLPYKVYRVTDTSNGDVIQDANIIYPTFMAERHKWKTDDPTDIGLETLGRDGFIYGLMGNFSSILTGDIFVQNAPGFGTGKSMVDYDTNQFNGFCFASHNALKTRIGARIDRQIQVYRPPTTGDSNGYMNSTKDGAQKLVCEDGAFVLVEADDTREPSKIPAGMQQKNRSSGIQVLQQPDMMKITAWSCYVMPLPSSDPDGFFFQEGDRILDEDGSEYIVSNPYRQDTGYVGSQLTLDRYVAGG